MLPATTALASELFVMEALESTQILFALCGFNDGHYLEKGVYHLRRIP